MISIPLSEEISLQQYCKLHRNDPLSTLLLSTFTRPQIDEDNLPILEKYCDTQVKITKNSRQLNAHGFNAAYCSGTFCIGFYSEEFWKSCIYKITIVDSIGIKSEEWACLSQADDFENPNFIAWYHSIFPIDLIKSKQTYQNKIANIHLRQDHGDDILKQHALRLLHNDYVESIINSLQFQPKAKQYISKCFNNGIIHIVLHWTDAGHGMAIKTTGRNIWETKKIAEILKNQYGMK